MRIKVLGASGSEVPGHECPAFLVDGTFLLDAGTIGQALHIREEHAVSRILLTHAHFDHIKGIPFMLDNLVVRNTGKTVTVMSGRDVLADLRKNIFNDRIWPDFTRIPSPEKPVLKYQAITPSRVLRMGSYSVRMERVHHTVPAYGYIVEDGDGRALAYTGDTGPTEAFWKRMASCEVRCLIVEVSFPNSMEELALRSGHLTASLLAREIEKIENPPNRIYVMHIKPQHQSQVEKEIEAIGRKNLEVLQEGEIIIV